MYSCGRCRSLWIPMLSHFLRPVPRVITMSRLLSCSSLGTFKPECLKTPRWTQAKVPSQSQSHWEEPPSTISRRMAVAAKQLLHHTSISMVAGLQVHTLGVWWGVLEAFSWNRVVLGCLTCMSSCFVFQCYTRFQVHTKHFRVVLNEFVLINRLS